jgi:CheY-like chemotaxis protein
LKKILIVDDERDVLEVLGARLTMAGYEVVKAVSGQEAINKTRKELPNLIILDILMPEMGGEEAGEILRKDPATKDIPIIFLTCLFTRREERNKGHSLGKNIFVAKPYDVKELLELIRRIIK